MRLLGGNREFMSTYRRRYGRSEQKLLGSSSSPESKTNNQQMVPPKAQLRQHERKRRLLTEWKKTFAGYSFDRDFLSSIFKELKS